MCNRHINIEFRVMKKQPLFPRENFLKYFLCFFLCTVVPCEMPPRIIFGSLIITPPYTYPDGFWRVLWHSFYALRFKIYGGYFRGAHLISSKQISSFVTHLMTLSATSNTIYLTFALKGLIFLNRYQTV